MWCGIKAHGKKSLPEHAFFFFDSQLHLTGAALLFYSHSRLLISTPHPPLRSLNNDIDDSSSCGCWDINTDFIYFFLFFICFFYGSQRCWAMPGIYAWRSNDKFGIVGIEDIPFTTNSQIGSIHAKLATTIICHAAHYGQCRYILFLTHFVYFHL